MVQNGSKSNVKQAETITCNCNQLNLTTFFYRRKQKLNICGVPKFKPDPSSLTPYTDKRKWMFKTQTVPTISSLKQKWGEDLAEILMKQMSPLQKRLLGIHAPLKGPPNNLWIDPRAQLEDKVEITVIPDEKYRTVLSQDGVLKISADIETKLEKYRNFMVKVAVEEAVAYKRLKARKEWNKILAYNETIHQRFICELQNTLENFYENKIRGIKENHEKWRDHLKEFFITEYSKEKRQIIVQTSKKLRENLVKLYEERYGSCLAEELKVATKKIQEQYKCFNTDSKLIMENEKKVIKKQLKSSQEYKNLVQNQKIEDVSKFFETFCQVTRPKPSMDFFESERQNSRMVMDPSKMQITKNRSNFLKTLDSKVQNFLKILKLEKLNEEEAQLIGLTLKTLQGNNDNDRAAAVNTAVTFKSFF